ncbi:chemotaxis protein CheW [Caulobacter vibrioides]|nr:chemotaxis protein CheW [Caulobacter vibrioides]YP_002516176.2 chemotaxis protein cheW [Caulobacter vibrioides NA1000]ACL94268.2 chemotaxis protein cheW [Caulobacter vibrioides NA1000]QXZ52842.1 chemotaxis protein CheW [Caulobacter vibrioides]
MMTDNTAPALELISFCIGEQEFCIDVKTVREIRGWTPATPIPHAPNYMRGVINLRGAIMPVIDLRNRLGLGVTIPETRHVIVVVECRDRLAGILVDAVSETFTVPRDSLQPAPDVGVEELRYIQAIISMENRLITYLRMDDVFPAQVSEAA